MGNSKEDWLKMHNEFRGKEKICMLTRNQVVRGNQVYMHCS